MRNDFQERVNVRQFLLIINSGGDPVDVISLMSSEETILNKIKEADDKFPDNAPHSAYECVDTMSFRKYVPTTEYGKLP